MRVICFSSKHSMSSFKEKNKNKFHSYFGLSLCSNPFVFGASKSSIEIFKLNRETKREIKKSLRRSWNSAWIVCFVFFYFFTSGNDVMHIILNKKKKCMCKHGILIHEQVICIKSFVIGRQFSFHIQKLWLFILWNPFTCK